MDIMNKRTCLFALVLILKSTSLFASDWSSLTNVDNGRTWILIDRNSIARIGIYKKAWFKTVYYDTQSIPAYAIKMIDDSNNYHSSVTLSYFNCGARTTATIQTLYYDETDRFVAKSEIVPSKAFYSEVAPDTAGEKMLDTVCQTFRMNKPPRRSDIE